MFGGSSEGGEQGGDKLPDLMDSGANLKTLSLHNLRRTDYTSVASLVGESRMLISDRGFEKAPDGPGDAYQMDVGDKTLYNKENCDEILGTLPAPVAQPLITETGSYQPDGFVPVKELVAPGTLPKTVDPHFVPRSVRAKSFVENTIIPVAQELTQSAVGFFADAITKSILFSLTHRNQRQQDDNSPSSGEVSLKSILTNFITLGPRQIKNKMLDMRHLGQRLFTSIVIKPVLKNIVAAPISLGISHGLLTAMGLKKVNPDLVPLLARGIFFALDFCIENCCELALLRCRYNNSSSNNNNDDGRGLFRTLKQVFVEIKNTVVQPFGVLRGQVRRNGNVAAGGGEDRPPMELVALKAIIAAASLFDGILFHSIKELATGSYGLSFCHEMGVFPSLKYGSALSYFRYYVVSSCWTAVFHPLGNYAYKVAVLDKLHQETGDSSRPVSASTQPEEGSDRTQREGGETSGGEVVRTHASSSSFSLFSSRGIRKWYTKSPVAWVGLDQQLFSTAMVFVKVYLTD